VHTVLGETVTVASRLQAMTGELSYPILIGEEAVRRSADARAQAVGKFMLEGLQNATAVYRLPVNFEPSHLQLVYSIERDKALSA
jgi:adenylate cyclase